MATIKDVARRANVAISTVSAVINRSAPVSEDVITRVQEAIREIGYVQHSAAKALRSGNSRLIGVIVPDITNPHFSMVARVAEKVCMEAGYMTFVYNTGEDADQEMRILQMMRMQRVAGLILISTRSDAAHGARLMAEINVPTVFLGSYVEEAPFDMITLDEDRASHLAIDYLLGLGHRDIAVISGRSGVSTNEERLNSCRRAFAEHGLELREDRIVPANFSQQQAYDGALALLSARDRPTAIFTLSNMMTIGAMRALLALKLTCPGDVSLIGIDDFEWPEILNPPVSVVAQPIVAMTECAIRTLLRQIASKSEPVGHRTLFPPELIIRASCAPVAHGCTTA